MARLITNNIISAPTGMNSKYWEDYLDAAKSRGDVFKGVGETLQGVEDGVTDYIKYKNEKAKEERQRAREDRADAMNEERFAMDKNTYTQNVADRTKREKAVSAYLADPNHDPAFDSMEGKAALDNYIVNGGNSIENFRAGLTNAALIKQQKKEEEEGKEAEIQESDTAKAVSQVLNNMHLAALSDQQLQSMDVNKRQQLLHELDRLHKTATDHNLNTLVGQIETQQLRLQGGLEKQEAAKKAQQNKEEKKSQDEKDADLFR